MLTRYYISLDSQNTDTCSLSATPLVDVGLCPVKHVPPPPSPPLSVPLLQTHQIAALFSALGLAVFTANKHPKRAKRMAGVQYRWQPECGIQTETGV